jgi:probable aminopeptidase NPEPL1
MGAGGLWGVGMAAKHPPALVVLRGPKSAADAPNMVWVGKGVVYDTGGLSLKPKGTMNGMKMDMGGAAGVLAAFEVAAARGVAQDLCAVLCLAENAIGPEALRNDDIITLYSGKTVEINNTDAEGRLILGDGVAYAHQHLSPVVIVDMATLTGAQLVATGRSFGALVCNDAELEEAAVEAGMYSGDLVHPLPYCPEFFQAEFKSAVADMKNSVKDRLNAQSSCAGHFVESHLGDYAGKWLHVDIAGPAFIQDRGTGFGVGLLSSLAEAWQRGELEG